MALLLGSAVRFSFTIFFKAQSRPASIENGFDEPIIGHSIYLCEKLFLTWDIYPE